MKKKYMKGAFWRQVIFEDWRTGHLHCLVRFHICLWLRSSEKLRITNTSSGVMEADTWFVLRVSGQYDQISSFQRRNLVSGIKEIGFLAAVAVTNKSNGKQESAKTELNFHQSNYKVNFLWNDQIIIFYGVLSKWQGNTCYRVWRNL